MTVQVDVRVEVAVDSVQVELGLTAAEGKIFSVEFHHLTFWSLHLQKKSGEI